MQYRTNRSTLPPMPISQWMLRCPLDTADPLDPGGLPGQAWYRTNRSMLPPMPISQWMLRCPLVTNNGKQRPSSANTGQFGPCPAFATRLQGLNLCPILGSKAISLFDRKLLVPQSKVFKANRGLVLQVCEQPSPRPEFDQAYLAMAGTCQEMCFVPPAMLAEPMHSQPLPCIE